MWRQKLYDVVWICILPLLREENKVQRKGVIGMGFIIGMVVGVLMGMVSMALVSVNNDND